MYTENYTPCTTSTFFFWYPLACVCMYAQLHIWEAMMMSFILLHVSMICVLCHVCVVVFQVPIACHFTCMHEKHWYSSRAAASASHLMRMSCKIKHGEFLCKVAVTCMQILLLLITILLSQMQFLHATSSFLLVLYPTPSPPSLWCTDLTAPACCSCANAGGAGWSHGGEHLHPCSLCFKHSDWALWWLKGTLVGNYSFYFGCVKSQTPPTLTKFV